MRYRSSRRGEGKAGSAKGWGCGNKRRGAGNMVSSLAVDEYRYIAPTYVGPKL